MFHTYYKNKKRTEKNVTSFQFFLLSLFYVLNITILIALVLLSSFQFLWVLLLFSERCSTTTGGVHPPSFYGQLINFHLRVLDLFHQQETKKKGRHDWNKKEKTPLKLMAGGTLISFLRAGLSKWCMAKETLNIFLLAGTWKIFVFFIIEVDYCGLSIINIHDKFASTNLTGNQKYI